MHSLMSLLFLSIINEQAQLIQSTSTVLTLVYNVRYTIKIMATNCIGKSEPYLMELFYGMHSYRCAIGCNNQILAKILFSLQTVNCGAPTTGSNVVAEGLTTPRVAEDTTVTFQCQCTRQYTLIGPTTAVCQENGQWEPDTSGVQCIGQLALTYLVGA